MPFIGGFHFSATPTSLVVRLGLFRVRIKTLPLAEIRSVRVERMFSPLSVFAGYGWRVNPVKRVTGYVLEGGAALEVRTFDWTYFLAMPDPDEFARSLQCFVGDRLEKSG